MALIKVAFKKGRTATVREMESRAIEPHEIRIRVQACGVCGTDLHEMPGDAREEQFGHEVAGTITEIGAAVRGLSFGQSIALDSATPCGACENCRNAQQELCTEIQSFWHSRRFGFSEEILAPGISAVPAGGMAPEVACLQEPLGVAIDLVRLADIRIDSNVLLIGMGPIGLMALSLVKRMGARRIWVSDFRSKRARMDCAMRFGADEFLDPRETALTEVRFGAPIDRILITAPPPVLPDAFRIAAKGGVIVFIGIEYGTNAMCRFDANEFHFKKLQLRASFASPALFGARAVQYLRERVVDGEALVSHRFPLGEISRALETARTDPDAIKVVVMPG